MKNQKITNNINKLKDTQDLIIKAQKQLSEAMDELSSVEDVSDIFYAWNNISDDTYSLLSEADEKIDFLIDHVYSAKD